MIALVEGRTQSQRPATTAKYNGQLKKLAVRACQWRQMVLSIIRPLQKKNTSDTDIDIVLCAVVLQAQRWNRRSGGGCCAATAA